MVETATRVWKSAAETLQFQITVPFSLQHARKNIKCFAFLPHFGGPRGMAIGLIIAPKFETDHELIEASRNEGLYWSFLNPAGYQKYDEELFKDALADWGYYGPTEKRPVWFET